MRLGGIGEMRIVHLAVLVAASVALANCSGGIGSIDPRYGVAASPRVVEAGQPIPKGGGVYRVGKPYVVAGRVYVPEVDPHYNAVGLASWYGDDFHGRYTANGEIFDKESISAAHPTLPLPSYARVTNLSNNRSIIVRVNDRGPYAHGRLIDLSMKTAHLLGFHGSGTAKVKVEYVGMAPLAGSDDRKLMATLREGAPAEPPVQVASANGSFAPGYPDRRRLGQSAPIPADRPYRLGEESDAPEAGAQPATGLASETRYERQPAAAPTAFAPVSSFSSERYSGPSVGFMSGRGLY